jgi:hypothetical protein
MKELESDFVPRLDAVGVQRVKFEEVGGFSVTVSG